LIVVDSYAWVEYFLGSEKGTKVEKYIESGEAITPSIVLAEIARKYLREGIDEKEVRKRLDFIVAKSTIIEMDVNLSIEAGKAYLELLEKVRAEKLKAPSLTDGIILATSRILKAKIITEDEHFRSLSEVIFME